MIATGSSRKIRFPSLTDKPTQELLGDRDHFEDIRFEQDPFGDEEVDQGSPVGKIWLGDLDWKGCPK